MQAATEEKPAAGQAKRESIEHPQGTPGAVDCQFLRDVKTQIRRGGFIAADDFRAAFGYMPLLYRGHVRPDQAAAALAVHESDVYETIAICAPWARAWARRRARV